MKCFLSVFILFTTFCFSHAQEIQVSAVRKPQEDFRQHLKNFKVFSGDQATLNQTDIPELDNWDQVQATFEAARDRRNLRWVVMPKFLRRTTFLYPQDGCFLRAALMNKALMAQFISPLPKLFVFGNLKAESLYEKGHSIYWYFHVALALRFQGEVFIIDPSLNNQRPLALVEWYNLMGVRSSDVEIRICDTQSYSPFDRCVGGQGFLEEKQRDDHVQYYLAAEWNNLEKLGFEPEKLLNHLPLWK